MKKPLDDLAPSGRTIPEQTAPAGRTNLRAQLARVNWVTSVFLLGTPILGISWGIAHGIQIGGVRADEMALFWFYVFATGMSITGGYHRLFAHRAYECSRLVKLFYVLFGAAAFQQSVIDWASDHRRHHKNIDDDGDPYNIHRGFFWAHIGWLLVRDERPRDVSNIPDLVADPLLRFQDRHYVLVASAMGFVVPLLIGLATGNPWGCLLWAGVIRVVVVHQSTFLVNSLAHYIGTRPYSREISARDSLVTAILTFGEGYHNFHHRFAADYRNGIRRHQYDPTKWLIRALAGVGLAWDLRRTPHERIVQAQLACDSQRLYEAVKDCSEQAAAYLRERVAEMSRIVEHAAARVGEIERQMAAARAQRVADRRQRVQQLQDDLRVARREFREARARWQATLVELASAPLPSASPA